ncbi:Krueppel-like factor 1 [Uloborus diversus]|uniref:Krueppel-like factor 1 n=1 Tax=Uloborus diversus TaxID=327109 RepID=UPI00240980E6|nr:Krueppel-like factor 1 [Uloborus diversus]
MAFKQIRHRASLFRPWAFGDNHILKQQKEETVSQLASLPERPELKLVKDNYRHENANLQRLDRISNTHIPCPWEISTELSFPVTSNISQLLEPPSTSKWKTKKQRPKRFQCPHCQVSFSNNGQLRGHIRIHTGERPFACEHRGCGKTFTRNEELTRHKRIHTGVRPHSCMLCGKRFGRKDHLKKHVKTHQRASLVRMPITAFHGLAYFDCVPWF